MREVDDALRQDEMMGFFKRFGLPLIVIVVVALVGFAAYLWWDHSRAQAAGERGESFVVALDDLETQNLEGADEKLAAIAAEDNSGSGAAAKLLRAGIALEDDRAADAVKLYGEVAADADAPQPYRDLATVRQVAANFDNMQPQEVIDRLKPLAVPGNAWFGLAGELVGMAYLKQEKQDLAGPLFAKIARDEEAPESLRGRARQLAGMLGYDAIEDVIETDSEREARVRSADQAAKSAQ